MTDKRNILSIAAVAAVTLVLAGCGGGGGKDMAAVDDDDVGSVDNGSVDNGSVDNGSVDNGGEDDTRIGCQNSSPMPSWSAETMAQARRTMIASRWVTQMPTRLAVGCCVCQALRATRTAAVVRCRRRLPDNLDETGSKSWPKSGQSSAEMILRTTGDADVATDYSPIGYAYVHRHGRLTVDGRQGNSESRAGRTKRTTIHSTTRRMTDGMVADLDRRLDRLAMSMATQVLRTRADTMDVDDE